MRTLLCFAWRELLRSRWRALLIALILTVQASALGGGFASEDSLVHTRDTYYARLHLADLDVQFVPAAANEMPSLAGLRAIPGVAQVSRRFVGVGLVEKPSGASMPVVVHYLEPDAHPLVDDIEMRSGSFLTPGHAEDAVIDRTFAESHGLSIGDELVVNPHRFETRLRVVGTALSPEYLVPTANPDLLIPHKGSLGIVYASREALDKTFTDHLYNNLVFTFAEGREPAATTRAIQEALGGLEVQRVVAKRGNFGFRFIEEMIGGSRVVMPAIALLLAIMALVVTFLSVSRLVSERRREIGCLLAHGFSPSQLVLGFVAIGLLPGLVGAALGVPGSMAFARLLTRANADITGFPEPMMLFAPGKLALASACAVLTGAGSALIPAASVLRAQPSDALRGAREIHFAGVPWPLEHLALGSTSVRYAIRNLFRRLRLSVATVALVALAIAMPAGLLTSLASYDAFAHAQTARLPWDAVATFKVPLDEAHVLEIMKTRGVGDFEGYVQGYASVIRDGVRPEEMRVRGIPVPSDLVTLGLQAGPGFSSAGADEAVLNVAFSHGHEPVVGETITVTARGVKHRLRVVGTVIEPSLSTIFVPGATAQRLFGLQGKFSGAHLRFGTSTAAREPKRALAQAPRLFQHEVESLDLDDAASGALTPRPAASSSWSNADTRDALLADELVTNVQVKTEFTAATIRYLASFNTMILPFVGLGGLLAFLFLLSVLGVVLGERETEYATLRTMGYDRGGIARMVLAEVTVLAAIGIALSLATWVLFTVALRGPMAKAWFVVPTCFRPGDFAQVAVPTAILLAVAALPGIRRIMRLDLATAMRGRGAS